MKDQSVFNHQIKLGVLGGGQLGKMMALPAANWHLPYWVMDQSSSFPAAPYASKFIEGNFKVEADVLAFGQQVDVVTIEIEHVHTGALKQLQAQGKKVHPDPAMLDIIKDKGLQKQFYSQHKIPTSDFSIYSDSDSLKAAIANGKRSFPFVQKSCTGGYDGKGVAVIFNENDLNTKLIEGASMVEDLVDIEKELAVVVAQNESGDIKSFPVVEMVFDPVANLVDYLLAPAQINEEVQQKAIELAERTAKAYGICGLLAVELFLTKNGEILVNEVAPRPHNSGHHTIESCVTSQFEQHLRGVLNLPLGETTLHQPAVMLNILGAEGHQGPARYEGLHEIMAMQNVYVHLYGKTITKPFRKMGHITVMGQTVDEVLNKVVEIKKLVKCKA